MDKQVWANIGLEKHSDFSLWTDRCGQTLDWTGLGKHWTEEHSEFSLWTDRSGQTLDWRSVVILSLWKTGLDKCWTGGAED